MMMGAGRRMPTAKEHKRMFGPCYYCGVRGPEPNQMDHFVPRYAGGPDTNNNLVAACPTCNAVKGRLRIEFARTRLILRRIGWPKFSEEQLSWLRGRGFDLTEFDGAKLWYEEQ